MRITAVNGSPRKNHSNSGELIRLLKAALPPDILWHQVYARDQEKPTPEALQGDILLITFPLYVDGLPSGLIRYLQEYRELCQAAQVKQRVYAAANCGFYEGEQNRSALRMIEAFAASANLTWCGGIGIGTGEMLQGLKDLPPTSGIRRTVFSAIEDFKTAMEEQTALKENL